MSIYFFIFFTLIIISSLFIIISKNVVTSILNLISVFILSAAMLLLLGAEFLSIILIIIYVGAIAVLFLFVIMMLNLRIVEVYNSFLFYFPIGFFMGLFFLIEFIYMIKLDLDFFSINYITDDYLQLNLIDYSLIWSNSNLYLIGDLLFNSYGFFLLLGGLILLLAMLGSIVLTVDMSYHSIKNKNIVNIETFEYKKNRITF
jgi:NADH-quinone oxidoreductase subunit J